MMFHESSNGIPRAVSTSGASGAIDVIAPDCISGWLLHPQHQLDSIKVYVDGNLIARCPIIKRMDVGKVYEHIAHAEYSGFSTQCSIKPKSIYIDGEKNNHSKALMIWCKNEQPVLNNNLMQRATGDNKQHTYKQVAQQIAADILTAINAHRSLNSIGTLLDWGCGSGRLAYHIKCLCPAIELMGCDIDIEAIAYCQKVLKCDFQVSNIDPPLTYQEGLFDVVVACSVFTHLTKNNQRIWLEEIRRILKPNGLFVASLHGQLAGKKYPSIGVRLTQNDFVDDISDNALDAIAPAGYYRSVFQTRSSALIEWSKFFKVVDYREGGLAGFQDLIIAKAT